MQQACLEASEKLLGVPHMVEEEADAKEMDSMGFEKYIEEQVQYVPSELVCCAGNDSDTLYHRYLIELEPDFNYYIQPHDMVLSVRTRLELDDETLKFDLDVDRGSLLITMRYIGVITLASEEVLLCQRFQQTVFRVLMDHNLNKLHEVLDALCRRGECAAFDYLLLPSAGSRENPLIDWKCVQSVQFSCENNRHVDCISARGHVLLLTKNGVVCSCVLENCLVVTPHNDHLYCITGVLDNLDGNSLLELKDGVIITYKEYFKQRHDCSLHFEKQPLLRGKHIFLVQNYLQRNRNQKAKEASKSSVELPPELCSIVMSPISVASFYSFSYAPSIMHWIESWLLAANLKRILVDHCMQIPTIKVLEAITTKHCREKLHMESLATLGDSFLKYAVSQQLFKTYKYDREGLLTDKRTEIISNASLCKLGCDHKIVGFIRNESFDPKAWIIPGDNTANYTLDDELVSSGRIFYGTGKRNIKRKRIADVVEALIGAFLDSGGELAALSFMEWLGIKVNFVLAYEVPVSLNPVKLVKVKFLESLLNYEFHDASLLVEALTHGSYVTPEIPRCYERLEFLGDAVLDYLITIYFYNEHPGLPPGLLTDLRSASVNNDCYARSAVKAGLHEHILCGSQELQRQIVDTVQNFEKLLPVETFGWESETLFPKVLGDIIESLAGAIFIDSRHNKEIVFQSIRPLLEPMVTLETIKLNPSRALNELCDKEHYVKKSVVTRRDGKAFVTVEVEANGVIYRHSCSGANKKTAQRLASKAVLKSLKESIPSI